MAGPRVDHPAPSDGLMHLLRALADPTRLRIFFRLREEERCVRDLVESEELPQPLVSHHLKVLTDAGLVQSRRADRYRLYAVRPEGMDLAMAQLSGVLDSDHLAPGARPGGNDECCR